jgi:hypothetical protein
MHMTTFVISERKRTVPIAGSDALWFSFHDVLKSVMLRNSHPPTYLTFSIEVEEALATHKLFRNGREGRLMLVRRMTASERRNKN